MSKYGIKGPPDVHTLDGGDVAGKCCHSRQPNSQMSINLLVVDSYHTLISHHKSGNQAAYCDQSPVTRPSAPQLFLLEVTNKRGREFSGDDARTSVVLVLSVVREAPTKAKPIPGIQVQK